MYQSIFYALVAREALLHRVVALADDAFFLFDAQRALSAAIVTRSILETMAVLGYLHDVFEKFDASGDEKTLYSRVAKVVVGARNMPDESPLAVHVLDAIRQTERRMVVPGLMSVYESLCEFTHPNWSGLLGFFGEHENAYRVVLGGPPRAVPPVDIHLAIVLSTFEALYDPLGDLIQHASEGLDRQRAGA
ncbi:hypothetical protein [Burkholderia sp. Bp9031]|uniref:hypothetical protein n=1 Tax=Burkholderia sp. Bp9031 TaxID=2184566 RepID=UPI000F5EA385|nr:hypothetical protein [Burkholderia sp. Bp9031]